jgi:hypothetical protein
MAASLDKTTVSRLLLRKTNEQIALIGEQAETVALGLSESISSLSNSTTFSREDANVVLSAVDHVRGLREAAPAAGPDAIAEPTLAHGMRFQPVRNPQGVTWGP